jgi:glycosyltransferase involved in cell wall biosynthesis
MHVVLQKADIVCLPSYREGFPKVLLEAMACGLPCITTDVPGCRAAVRHNDNGLLIPVNDPDALAAAISTLAKNQEMRVRMGQRGRARTLEEFSQEQINKMTLLAYQEVLSA